jgi:uridine nucleosidase
MNLNIKKAMIPLNVTHTALVTSTIRRKLLDPAMAAANGPLPPAITPLRHMLSSLMTFFAEAYEATFGFLEGPPLHDALTIVYVAHPELFKCRRYRVDIELEGRHTIGETVVDLWEYTKCDDSWGRDGRNCIVAQSVEVQIFTLLSSFSHEYHR